MKHEVAQYLSFYDTLSDQSARRAACAEYQNATYLLVAYLKDDSNIRRLYLPAFQINVPVGAASATYQLFDFETDTLIGNLPLSVLQASLGDSTTHEAYYRNEGAATLTYDVVIGKEYYMKATIGGTAYFSEVFTVVSPTADDGRGWVTSNDCDRPILKLTYTLDCDVQEVLSSAPVFNMYLDTELSSPEHELIQRVEKDGLDREFATYKNLRKIYTFTTYVPEYIVDAIANIQLYDTVTVEEENGAIFNVLKDTFEVDSVEWDNGCMAYVVCKFAIDSLIKVCC